MVAARGQSTLVRASASISSSVISRSLSAPGMNSPECASVNMNFSFSYSDSAAHTLAIVICAKGYGEPE